MLLWCCECKQHLPAESFHSSDAHQVRGGKSPRCKPCNIAVAGRWYRENKDRKRAYDAKRREEKRELYRAAGRRFARNNPEKTALYTNARRKKYQKATPAWVDKWMVREAYHLAQVRSRVTGVKHHVDHIVPIQGETVCGLHVPWNLQVITAEENMLKSNRLDWEGRR